MTTRPPISFIIPVYNYGHFLGDAVRSICDENMETGDELLLVDDASTDNSAEVMKALAATYPQIRLLAHRQNKRCATAGLNTAIEAARHDLFFGLAADNILLPRSISPLVTYLFENNADVAAFEEVRFFDKNPATPTHTWHFKELTTLADALAGFHWPGTDGNYLFTRKSWLKAGRCDEFFGGIDSWAFGLQQLASGSKMMAMPGTGYLHRWGHESLFVREDKAGSLSIKGLRALLPMLHLLEPESVDYLFSPEGRTSWFENLEKRPLRLKDGIFGADGTVAHHPRKKDPFFTRARWILAHLIAPKK